MYSHSRIPRNSNQRRQYVTTTKQNFPKTIFKFVGNIVNELEENLNMIEEIDGYLKVVRSFPLVSLNFLKNLKAINGNFLESQK